MKEKRIKKLIVLFLCFTLCFSLIGCEEKEAETIPISIWAFYDEMVSQESITNYLSSLIPSGIAYEYDVQYFDASEAEILARSCVESQVYPDIVFGRYALIVNTMESTDKSSNLSKFLPQTALEPIKELSRNHPTFLPLAINYTCMAVNYEMMEDSGAKKYINEETRTWSTDGFRSSVKALYSFGQANVASVYCGGQSGAEGTLALINNLYGGNLCDNEGNYTMNSEENLKSLDYLTDLSSIKLDNEIIDRDETLLFLRGQYAMSISWTPQMAHSEANDFTPYPLSYPNVEGIGFLPGTVYGAVAFETQEVGKQEGIEQFLSLFYQNGYSSFIESNGILPVDTTTVYADDEQMQPFLLLRDYVTVFYETYPNYERARAQWWQVLSAIANGADIEETVAAFTWSMTNDLA